MNNLPTRLPLTLLLIAVALFAGGCAPAAPAPTATPAASPIPSAMRTTAPTLVPEAYTITNGMLYHWEGGQYVAVDKVESISFVFEGSGQTQLAQLVSKDVIGEQGFWYLLGVDVGGNFVPMDAPEATRYHLAEVEWSGSRLMLKDAQGNLTDKAVFEHDNQTGYFYGVNPFTGEREE